MSRYARQMILPAVGEEGQARMSAARILVVGAGGLAAPVLPLLAGAGVGHLTIMDRDEIALSNLHRQTLFTEQDCGRSKAQVAATRCRSLNQNVGVLALEKALTSQNVHEFVAQADVILDCADSYAASYTLSDACFELGQAADQRLGSGSVGICGRLLRWCTVIACCFSRCAGQRCKLCVGRCAGSCGRIDRRDAGTNDARRDFGF